MCGQIGARLRSQGVRYRRMDVVDIELALQETKNTVYRYQSTNPCALLNLAGFAKNFVNWAVSLNSKRRNHVVSQPEEIGEARAGKRNTRTAEENNPCFIPSI